MEKTSLYSGHKPLCLISFAVLAICAVSSLLMIKYTKTQLRQVNQRFGKLEGKLKELESSEVGQYESHRPNRSDVQHRVKRSVPSTLTGVSTRLKTLENRMNKHLSKILKGRDGRDGRDGQPGPAGPHGATGAQGTKGSPGDKGGAGPQGKQGVAGLPGPPGPQGIQGPTGGGVSYVRWGKTTCPQHAHLVYQGIIGGSYYNQKGGGSNYVCLAKTPKYAKYNDAWQGTGAIYGAEYEVNTFNPFKRKLQDHEAPCAVCYVLSRSSQLMYPARNDCPSGWAREYWGYLMTEHYNHPASRNFICVDQDAEYVHGTKPNKEGALMYLVQGDCGSLPCAPYVQGRELTCAVCSK